ncbi:MAG: LysM peptidoglycan-binding domain-containing protein [Synergistaceae bacterium]|nr:LysM peptidoglycan-binding domain-containing protein [Synergistaceae bacterium]MBQ6740002.1 LysM peptidoglycan-binding domain-containing protein [Synergistaceae bacterium]MBQ7569638.1 LysM peptidoglycan-binding domain-containing protein [Synergistaceae bacterium]MBQ9582154.1 LysM peptidoglycan-binding domain-containing protein [Synergistaceae bacterium]MBQ9896337.1 LysM peptidoglycan-binding domain-containing protein [Synergistaceae bacterium]
MFNRAVIIAALTAIFAIVNLGMDDKLFAEDKESGAAWREHIVKAGETLSDIAKNYGDVTDQDILRANGLKDENNLSPNKILLIPKDHSKVEDTYNEVKTRQMRILAARYKPKPLKISAYVVAQGDSLWSIAESQGIELDTLIGCNSFKSSAKLKPGSTIRVPNQDGIFYQLAKGDKIENLCKLYGVDLDKLKLVNPTIDIAALKTGDEIFLPGAKLNAVNIKNNRYIYSCTDLEDKDYFIDSRSIIYNSENKIIKFWSKAINKNGAYSMNYYEINTTENLYRIISIINYSAKHKILSSKQNNALPWKIIVPESVTETLRDDALQVTKY